MSRPPKYQPIVWIRRGLLIALVAFLGVMTTLLVRGREDAAEDDAAPPAIADEDGRAEDEIQTGEGFVHEVSEGGQRRFRISATSWTSTRDEFLTFQNPSIEVFREDGNDYLIEAEQGTYQEATSTARLDGNVRIGTADGLEIRGPGFELQRNGKVIVSTAQPVRFRYQDRYEGRANNLTSNVDRKRTELEGRVRISSLAGEAVDASMAARRMIHDELAGRIHAEGGVRMRRNDEEINARRLTVTLDEEGKRPRFVRAKFEVSGSRSVVKEGLAQALRFQAAEISVIFDPSTGDPAQAELDGSRRKPAVLDVEEASGEVRRLTTPYMVVEFAGGEIRRADATGPVSLRNFLAFDTSGHWLMRGCADSAVAAFEPGGGLDNLTLEGDVDLNQPDSQISGERLVAAGDEVVVTGSPAEIFARRGEFRAPAIAFNPDGGTGKATGGVRAILSGESEFGLMTAAKKDVPVQVTAETAEWIDARGAFVFENQVRAWQEENYLVAETLRVTDNGRTLDALGGVKTVIKKARKIQAESPGEGNGEGDEADEAEAPLEVTAAKLHYDGDSDRLNYTGTPKARQAGRTLSCNDLEVRLDDASEVDELLCKGNTLIDNPPGGHTVRGQEALFKPGEDSVLVTGTPVVMRDKSGGEIRGARLLYDLETGTAQVQTSPAPEPVERAGEDGTGATEDEASDDGEASSGEGIRP